MKYFYDIPYISPSCCRSCWPCVHYRRARLMKMTEPLLQWNWWNTWNKLTEKIRILISNNNLKRNLYSGRYVKYVHQLCQQHSFSANYTEAALTLLLHADLLEWSPVLLSELHDPPFPEERYPIHACDMIRIWWAKRVREEGETVPRGSQFPG